MSLLLLQRAQDLINQCSFKGLSFDVIQEGPEAVFLRVECAYGACNFTGDPFPWKGRKFRLSSFMTDGEIVQTAFLAIMTSMEHEVREIFTFQGASVFDPHYDIYKLVELRNSNEALDVREEPGKSANAKG